MSNKLYVGNLSFNTTENDLSDAFAAFGQVTETNLMMDRETGRPRGFGFVTMGSSEEAKKAIEGANEQLASANGDLKQEKARVEAAQKVAVRNREEARLALLTLTDRLPAAEVAPVMTALEAHFTPVLPRPFVIEDLCLFGEDATGFHLLHRYALTG